HDFEHDKPVWAGVRLRREVLQRLRLSDSEPVDTVKQLARQAGVPVRAAGHYDMGRIIKDVNGMDKAAAEACLTYTLDDIDFDLGRAGKTGAAWAIGDLETVRVNYQGSALANCLRGSGKGAALVERGVNDTVAAIDRAAVKPGKTVVVVPLAILLRRGGVLERLRTRGYEVSSPE
ncbi:MAG: TraB/GumN family protein, partial [Asticcacaulis sp.]|nr:TraB/GumN family protein [Asticcacaulis sp.]